MGLLVCVICLFMFDADHWHCIHKPKDTTIIDINLIVTVDNSMIVIQDQGNVWIKLETIIL